MRRRCSSRTRPRRTSSCGARNIDRAGIRHSSEGASGDRPHVTLSSRWPDGPLFALDGADPLVDELLKAAPLVGLRRIDIALRIGRDAVDGEELSRLAAAVA